MRRHQTLSVRLRKPLERSLRSGHPWLYREALEAFEAAPGTAVRVLDRKGGFVASGLCEAGPIAVRVFSVQDRAIDAGLFAERIDAALELRRRFQLPETDAYRLLHGEGDRLPGVVCDRYGSRAVLKLDGEAALSLAASWTQLLRERLPALGVETLLVRTSRKHGESVSVAWGPEPPRELEVRERGMALVVNLYDGQKTGLFLDHRESRARVRGLAAELSVLNLYGYTGGFSIAAGLGGAAQVTTVDQAKPALALADRSWTANGLPAERHQSRAGDVVEYLTAAADRGDRHGLIIADPPNFAPRQSALEQALRAYEALHAGVLKLLSPGGLYLAASCSSHVDRSAFEQTLYDGARRARRVLQVLERSGAPADHPRLLAFPEGDYLKVALLRAD
ncbi:MAG TPA: class I SAM-dependent rRNA methyltransferase [Polyangiales bacterium]|nr:class I SAM-dependent rRNA methyltransferase [Polyangiales bacterium]